jgi:MerR family transcriptional regulator/heat shock protein HspR
MAMRGDRFEEKQADSEPCYVISVAAKMLGLHAQTLRYYERLGLVAPSRSRGNFRLYSQSDLNRVRQIKRLMNDLGVNLAGVEVILRMSDRMRELEQEIERLNEEVRLARERRALPEASEERSERTGTGGKTHEHEEIIYL